MFLCYTRENLIWNKMQQPISSYLPSSIGHFYQTAKAKINSQLEECEKLDPIFKTAFTVSYIVSNVIYSSFSFTKDLPTLLLPTIFITGPITKLAYDILLENGKNNILNNINVVSATATFYIVFFGLFSSNYSYLTNSYLMMYLLNEIKMAPNLWGKTRTGIGFFIHATRFAIFPLIQLAKTHLYNEPLPYVSNNIVDNSLSQVANQTANVLQNQSSIFSWINFPVLNTDSESIVNCAANTTLTAIPSNVLISENQNSLWEKITPFTQNDQSHFVGNTTLNQDILATTSVTQIPLKETIPSLSTSIVSMSSSYMLPILGGIIATAGIGYLAFRLYKTLQSHLPKTTSLNESFQKINKECNLLEIETACATMNDPNRYLITRYVISNVKFIKAFLLNSARCVGYVALSTFFFLSIFTQNGRSYLRANTLRIFTSLGGIFISLLGIGSPFLGRAAYVTYMKKLYPLLSETKEKLSSTQIHQLLSIQA